MKIDEGQQVRLPGEAAFVTVDGVAPRPDGGVRLYVLDNGDIRSVTLTGWPGSHICLPPWARNPRVALHEVAHVLAQSTAAAHGPEFAATLLTLVEGRLGTVAARALRGSYRQNRVRYRAGMAAVPKAGSRYVPSRAEEAKREREAKVRRRRDLASSPEHRNAAAEVIRALAAEGHFGPSGSPARARTLALARSIEMDEAG